jgi:hypothetical protein
MALSFLVLLLLVFAPVAVSQQGIPISGFTASIISYDLGIIDEESCWMQIF